MKIYILMPTYNDVDSIEETLNSILIQTYKNWNLIIIDDGSKDKTKEFISKYIDDNNASDKITYVYQENADQLNAIKNGMNYIQEKDSLIYILHSDDILNTEFVFEKAVNYFENNNCEAILGDLVLIDGNSKVFGYQKIRNYTIEKHTCAIQELWLGRQLFIDFAFWKYDAFFKKVYYNYLTWNEPYWLTTDNELKMMNVKKVDFPFIKYRVFEGNYINNEIGLLNVLNGELRTLIGLMKYIHIPFYKIQYFCYRVFNKLKMNYHCFFSKKENTNKYNIIKFVISKRINDNDLQKYPYYTAILNFYKNKINKKIELKNINNNDVFLGSDMRKFNKMMVKNELPSLYYILFSEMKNGFDVVETTEKDYENVVKILKFMDIYQDVEVIADEK